MGLFALVADRLLFGALSCPEFDLQAAIQVLHAVLLLGPTGSGKTPVGDLCERAGLWGRRCAHFDFGVHLRKAAKEGGSRWGLRADDLETIRCSVSTGVLLENESFHIARALLSGFVGQQQVTNEDLLVLNGLPRHAGQARDMEDLVHVRMVVTLWCVPDVVRQRIRLNTGGDREGRGDDSPAEVTEKLRLFTDRTLPLITYYHKRGVRVEQFDVRTDTTAHQIHEWMDSLGL